jgi:hypothetical protein
MQRTVRFDNRTAPISLGYPSLLKQQLRIFFLLEINILIVIINWLILGKLSYSIY